MKKRISCFLLVLIVFITAILPSVAYADDSDLPFTDVPKGHWAYNSVKKVYDLGYMSGTSATYFSANTVMDRAMISVVIARAAGAELGSSDETVFSDVPRGAYYTAAVNWAYSNGLISGDGKGHFMPNNPVTREQIALMLRALGDYLNYDVTYQDDSMLILFHDNGSISDYARSAIAWAVDYGILSGNNDHALSPKKSATRAEVAAMVASFLNYRETPPKVPPIVRKVTFKNWDGKVLYTDYVADGDVATYRGAVPQRPDTKTNYFIFNGWDKPLSTKITNDTVFTAQYTKMTLYFNAYFKNWDGKTLYKVSVAAGKIPAYSGSTPTRPDDDTYKYTFSGWSPTPSAIYSDVTYTAKYTATELPNKNRDFTKDVLTTGRFDYNGTNFRMSQSLNDRLYQKLANSEGRTTGIYVIDIQTHATLAFNANVDFPTASTVKAGYALTAYKMADQGRMSMNDIWTYYHDLHYCVRTGKIKDSADGTKYRAGDVIYEMIHESDNAAFYMTQYYLGYKNYNAEMEKIGFTKNFHTHNQQWGYYTPQQLGMIMNEVYLYRDQTANGKALFNLFLNAKYNFIKNGLKRRYGSSIQIAHKSGFNDHAYNDAAIVFGARPYIMVIMTKPGDLDDREEYVRSTALLLDEYMQEYGAYMKTHKY